MDSKRRADLTMAAQVDLSVSQMVARINTMASESTWTEEQRQAIRIVAGRLGSVSFQGFERLRKDALQRKADEESIRQLAERVATLPQRKGEASRIVVDDLVIEAARRLTR